MSSRTWAVIDAAGAEVTRFTDKSGTAYRVDVQIEDLRHMPGPGGGGMHAALVADGVVVARNDLGDRDPATLRLLTPEHGTLSA